jgi:carboxymethylenebutenolidase
MLSSMLPLAMHAMLFVLVLPAAGQTNTPAIHAGVQKITLRSGTDDVRAYCFRPAGKGPFPALVVLHGDFGLTDWVKKQAERLANKGYLTVAIDLYRGELPRDIEEAHILERALPADRVLRDIKAALDFLVQRPEVRKERLGIIGWDMGGGWALEGAMHDARLRATVLCYGRLCTDPQLLARLNASVLGIFAEDDEGTSPQTRQRFQEAMKRAGKRLDLQVFKKAGSSFMEPDSLYRDGPPALGAAVGAWQRIDAYLQAELRP